MNFDYEPLMSRPRLFTLDTDIGCDCDDAGCLSVLFRKMKEKQLPLGAVINCTPSLWGCGAIDAIGQYHEMGALPLAQAASPVLEAPCYHVYDGVLTEEYPNAYCSGDRAAEDALTVYLRLLEQAPEGGMVLISVGPLHLLGELWERAPELITKKVYALICMGGVYEDFDLYGHREYNFKIAADATRTVFEQFPCPIVCVGLELGKRVMSGFSRVDRANPVNRAYEIHTKGRLLRPSWDPLTMLFALEGEGDRFVLSESGRNEIAEDGSNYFRPDPTGRHFYLKAKKSYRELAEELNGLYVAIRRS